MNKALKDLVSGFMMYPTWTHQAYHILGAKYKRTILGTLWVAGNFVFSSLAISIVFGALFQQDLRTLLPYSMLGFLVGGTCLWILSEAPEVFMSKGNMIKNHAYPYTYFVFEDLSRLLFLFGHNLIVFYVFMAVNQTMTLPHWSVIPGFLLVVLTMFSWGLVIGMLSARFRDMRFLLPNISYLFFFLTPIYWHVELLREKRWIAEYNPLYNLVCLIREPLLGHAPTANNWIQVSLIAGVGVLVALVSFSIYRRRIPFWV